MKNTTVTPGQTHLAYRIVEAGSLLKSLNEDDVKFTENFIKKFGIKAHDEIVSIFDKHFIQYAFYYTTLDCFFNNEREKEFAMHPFIEMLKGFEVIETTQYVTDEALDYLIEKFYDSDLCLCQRGAFVLPLNKENYYEVDEWYFTYGKEFELKFKSEDNEKVILSTLKGRSAKECYKTYLHKIYLVGEKMLTSPEWKKQLEKKYDEDSVSEILVTTYRLLNEYGSQRPKKWFSSLDVFKSLMESNKRTRLYSGFAYEIINFECEQSEDSFYAGFNWYNLPSEYRYVKVDKSKSFIQRRESKQLTELIA